MSGAGIPTEKLVLYGKTLTLALTHLLTVGGRTAILGSSSGTLGVHQPHEPGESFSLPEQQIPHLENEASILPPPSSLKGIKVRGVKSQERI